MRILFLALDVDLAKARGEAAHTLALASALASGGDTVELVVGAAAGSGDVEGVHVIEVGTPHDLRAVRRLSRLVKRARPDVIYERRFSPKIGWSLASLHSIPLAVEINGIPMDEARMQGRPTGTGLGASAKGTVRDALLRKAQAVIAVTPGLKAALVRRFGVDPERVIVVPNGVDQRVFTPQDRDRARDGLHLESGTWVGFVGNLVGWQGLGMLLNAAAATPPDHRFLLVGDGPDRVRLQEQSRRNGTADRVRFVGQIPHERVPEYIAASDVCVAPFTAERNVEMGLSPLKLYEYLACARPVVVSDVPGVADLVRRLGAGIVVPPDDPRQLAWAITTAAADPVLRANALRAADVVREEFSWEATGRAVSRALRGVVGP